MRIGWFLTCYGALGGVRSVIETGNSLIRMGHEFYVLGNVGDGRATFCNDTIPIQNHVQFSIFQDGDSVSKLCEKYNFDLLFNQDPATLIFSNYVRSKYKAVHYCGADGACYKDFNDVIPGVRTACSEHLLQVGKDHDVENKHKHYFIGQGINFNEFHPMSFEHSIYKNFRNNNKINVVCCGSRGGPRISNKGTYDIIEASKLLDNAKYNFIYFDLTKQDFPDNFKGIETNARQNSLKHVYAIADIFVAPDYVSAWNCCAGEAMACKKPVIASTKGIDDFGRHLENCIIYKEGDHESPKLLASYIDKLSWDVELREKLASNGYLNIQRFTWDNVAKRIVDLWDELENV